ncbi:MAG: sigma-54 dependent transcriptional regulator [Pseudomonadota bacterium]
MNAESKTILIVDDDEDILTAGRLLLKRTFSQILTCQDPAQIPTLLASHSFDAILLDMNFSPGDSSGEQGFFWLRRVLEIDPDAVVVMITAHGSLNLAVEAMKLGATDFVAKPWQNEKVVATLSAAVKLRTSRAETAKLKRRNRALASASGSGEQHLMGDSPPMRELLSLIERSAPTDANILIMGENGTGKELVARLIHQQSVRSEQVFMAVDMGSVSETLFESELFGHRKGAFTGASADRVGRLEAANGGTLFLDEIGNIPLSLQAKLLTVLEQREVMPVGSNHANPIDVRVLAATNVPREELADESRFRQDLLFRLNTVELTLPPLRERGDDIIAIAKHFSRVYAHKYKKPLLEFSDEALHALRTDPWPGNVRSLRHAVERAVILAQQDSYEAWDLQLAAKHEFSAVRESATESRDTLNLERIEKQTIEKALKQHRYNISHASKELGLTRAALYRRMEKHGL